MKEQVFMTIFDKQIYEFLRNIRDNNSQIQLNDLEKCKYDIYNVYSTLNKQYKAQIFSKDQDCLLDRHRVAACICGAFLKTPVFNKTVMIENLKKTHQRVEAVFYYVNEFAAFYAGCKYLSMFMVNDNKNDNQMSRSIIEYFPIMPQTSQIKTGFWNCLLFNLSQIKDSTQIGLDHYDLYAYAMIFFGLEKFFYNELKLIQFDLN